MGQAVYEIVGSAGEWRIRHDGNAENVYQTEEFAFEAAIAAASLALRQGSRSHRDCSSGPKPRQERIIRVRTSACRLQFRGPSQELAFRSGPDDRETVRAVAASNKQSHSTRAGAPVLGTAHRSTRL